jgi:hypothetical protein
MDFDDCWIRILDAGMFFTLRKGGSIPMGWMTFIPWEARQIMSCAVVSSQYCTISGHFSHPILGAPNIANMHFAVSENGSQIYLIYLIYLSG